jgi:tetratricopeptide (TPR) repeat protein
LAQGAAATDVEACFLSALEADPTHRPSLEALEASARKAKNEARLAQLLDLKLAAGGAQPNERKAWLTELVGLYTGPLGQPPSAIPALRELVAVAPTDLKLQEDLGRALIAAGQIPEASSVLTSLLDALGKAKQPKAIARVQQALGNLAERQGQHAVALQRYEAAYQLDPAQPAVLAALGRLAMQQNDAEKARRYYRSLLLQSFDERSVGVSKADVYLALGRLHITAQELPKARNMFERGLEADPKHAALKEALAALPRA